MFDWTYLWDVMPVLVEASGVTVFITIAAATVSMIAGLVFALCVDQTPRFLGRIVQELLQFVRVTPLLVQLFFVFYVLPVYGLTLSPIATGVAVIGIHFGAYACEIYRAGFAAIPRGQHDAIIALNYGRLRAGAAILLPQAVRPMIPAFGSNIIALLKDTALMSAIAAPELVGTGKKISFFSFKYLEVFTAIGLIFLILSYLFGQFFKLLEHKLSAST